jgi:hypothetical protein
MSQLPHPLDQQIGIEHLATLRRRVRAAMNAPQRATQRQFYTESIEPGHESIFER